MFGMRDELQTVPVHGAIRDMLDGWQQCPSTDEMRQMVQSSAQWQQYKQNKLYTKTKRALKDKLGIDVTLETWSTLHDWIQASNHSGVNDKALPKAMTPELIVCVFIVLISHPLTILL